MQEPLVGDGHRIASLFQEENRIPGIDLVRSADGLLHQGEISAGESTDSLAPPHRTRDFASEPSFGSGCGECRQKRANRGIAQAWEKIVKRRTVEDAQLRSAHQPEMQRRNVRVSHERLGIPAEHVGVKIGE